MASASIPSQNYWERRVDKIKVFRLFEQAKDLGRRAAVQKRGTRTAPIVTRAALYVHSKTPLYCAVYLPSFLTTP
jgi:hypothetical protein